MYMCGILGMCSKGAPLVVGGAPALRSVVPDEVLGCVEVRCALVAEEGVLPGNPEDG
nr:MAG TPA: hypothetical protein [Caudoviricetes sp.]